MKRWLQIAVFTALAGVAYAQPPFAWWENPVANGLNLSDAQRDQINAIVSQFRDRLNQERQDAERAESEFESVVNADTVDNRRGWNAIDQLAKSRDVFTRDISTMILRLRAVLTADQWRTVQERQGGRAGREGGKGRGPDGRGRRPAPSQTGSAPAH